MQPIDTVHGAQRESKEDCFALTLLSERKPFLVVWKIRCDPWCNIQHLNYTKEELLGWIRNVSVKCVKQSSS